jgi:hypothetical protein
MAKRHMGSTPYHMVKGAFFMLSAGLLILGATGSGGLGEGRENIEVKRYSMIVMGKSIWNK